MWDLCGQLLPYLHLRPQLSHGHSPLQAKDAVEECVLWRPAMQDKDTAQHVEVEVILMQIAQQPGLEEGGPSLLESQPSSAVPLGEEDGRLVFKGEQCEGSSGFI